MSQNASNTVQMSNADLQKRIAELEAELAAKNNRQIYFRVGEPKGAVGMYGFSTKGTPVSLYAEQWPKAIEALTGKAMTDDMPIAKFLKSAEKYASLKGDGDVDTAGTIAYQKRLLRKAESHGIVAHPKNNSQTA